jgi:hypothetical protein
LPVTVRFVLIVAAPTTARAMVAHPAIATETVSFPVPTMVTAVAADVESVDWFPEIVRAGRGRELYLAFTLS